jgi:hypothetical protein
MTPFEQATRFAEYDCYYLNTLIPDFLVFVAGHEHNPQKDQSL